MYSKSLLLTFLSAFLPIILNLSPFCSAFSFQRPTTFSSSLNSSLHISKNSYKNKPILFCSWTALNNTKFSTSSLIFVNDEKNSGLENSFAYVKKEENNLEGYDYYGRGLNRGDCGFTVQNMQKNDFGAWTYFIVSIDSETGEKKYENGQIEIIDQNGEILNSDSEPSSNILNFSTTQEVPRNRISSAESATRSEFLSTIAPDELKFSLKITTFSPSKSDENLKNSPSSLFENEKVFGDEREDFTTTHVPFIEIDEDEERESKNFPLSSPTTTASPNEKIDKLTSLQNEEDQRKITASSSSLVSKIITTTLALSSSTTPKNQPTGTESPVLVESGIKIPTLNIDETNYLFLIWITLPSLALLLTLLALVFMPLYVCYRKNICCWKYRKGVYKTNEASGNYNLVRTDGTPF